jgi:hypothetical protein
MPPCHCLPMMLRQSYQCLLQRGIPSVADGVVAREGFPALDRLDPGTVCCSDLTCFGNIFPLRTLPTSADRDLAEKVFANRVRFLTAR